MLVLTGLSTSIISYSITFYCSHRAKKTFSLFNTTSFQNLVNYYILYFGCWILRL